MPPRFDAEVLFALVHGVRVCLALNDLAGADGKLLPAGKLQDLALPAGGTVNFGGSPIRIAPANERRFLAVAGRQLKNVAAYSWLMVTRPPPPDLQPDERLLNDVMAALFGHVQPFGAPVTREVVTAAWRAATNAAPGAVAPRLVVDNIRTALARLHLTNDGVLADADTVRQLLVYASTRPSPFSKSRVDELPASTDGAATA